MKNINISILPVVPADSLAIFEISNQDYVRKNSFDHKNININEHRRWFKNKLDDKNVLMLKATVGGKIAGQVRLDIKNNKAIVGVSVLKSFQGMGIASALLQTIEAKAKTKKLFAIEAYIRPENIASRKLFEKNGWVLDGETMVGKNKAIKYINLL